MQYNCQNYSEYIHHIYIYFLYIQILQRVQCSDPPAEVNAMQSFRTQNGAPNGKNGRSNDKEKTSTCLLFSDQTIFYFQLIGLLYSIDQLFTNYKKHQLINFQIKPIKPFVSRC